MAPSPIYSGDSWTQLTSRPQGFGDGLYDDLPGSDWVKIVLEVLVLVIIVVTVFKKVKQHAKFKRTLKMSEQVEANLSPELQAKVAKAAGYGLGDVVAVGGVGTVLLIIMWFL